MWIEETNSGKFKFIERYFDPLTEKQKKVSIVMDKNTASTRKLAFEELQRKISQKLDTINSSNTTLSQLKDKYLAYQKKTVKLSTWERNSRTLEVLTDLIGPAAIVDKLTAQYVKDALLTRTEQPGTLNEYITRLKAMLRWGYQNDLMENIRLIDKLQPFKDISHREKIKYKYLEPDELDSLLKYMEQRPYYTWYYVTAILVLSGLRIGELTALHTEDIDDYIHVTKTYDAINKVVTTPKTAMSVRDVYIQPELHTVLQRYDRYIREYRLEHGIDTELYIFDRKGTYISYYSYEKYLKEASEHVLGRRITAHALRHTHASLLLAEGIDIDTISRRLGHENSKVTKEIYLHVTQKIIESDNEKLSKVNIL